MVDCTGGLGGTIKSGWTTGEETGNGRISANGRTGDQMDEEVQGMEEGVEGMDAVARKVSPLPFLALASCQNEPKSKL